MACYFHFGKCPIHAKLARMKILSSVFALLILAFVLSFVLSNRQDAMVALWPFVETVEVPLYLVGLAPLVLGLFVGGLGGWLSSIPHRMKARRLTKALGALTNQFDALQNPEAPAPKSSFWKFK